MRDEIIRMLVVLSVFYVFDCIFAGIILYIFSLFTVANVLFTGYAVLAVELAFISYFIFHLYDRIF